MKFNFNENPRTFNVKGFSIKDYGKIFLDPCETISFITKSGKECDFTAQEWGFYVAPSLNSRLKNQGFKTALVINESNQIYVMAVETDKIDLFKKYLKTNQNNKILCWLDDWLIEEK